MVWGMPSPGSFGKFFPGGEYAGWHEDLIDYFKNEMPADQKALFRSAGAYPSYVSKKFVDDPAAWQGSSKQPPFSPVEPHEAPKRFVLKKIHASLGSLIKTNNFIPAVDEPLKKIIERFEPGVHRFFPIELPMKYPENSEVRFRNYPAQFFVLAIGQYIDSFLPEQSDPSSFEEMWPDHFAYRDDKKSMSGLALSKQIFGGAHLWRERRFGIPLICFSETLMAEIDKAGLQIPKHYRLKEL